MRLLRLFKRELAHDARGWVERELVTPAQADAILAGYGATMADAEGDRRGSLALTAIAAVLLGLSAIVLIGANWEAIPRAVRLVALVGSTGATSLAGAWLWRRGREGAAKVTLLLGGLLYGASIFLVGQMYHLGEHFPDGLFFWTLGVLPAALVVRSRMLMLLATLTGAGWMLLATATSGFPLLYVGLLATQVLFVARVRRSLLLVGVTVIAAGTALNAAVIDLLTSGGGRVHAEPFFVSVAYFVAVFGASRLLEHADHPWARDYGALLHAWTVRFSFLLLLPLTFSEPWRELLSATRDTSPWVVWACVAFAAFVTVFVTSRLSASPLPGRELLLRCAPLACWTLLFGASTWLLYGGTREIVPWLQVIGTVALLLESGWLILRGAQTGSATAFYVGVGGALVTALCRYVDLVGDYLGTSLLFFLCGVALFAAARVWLASAERRSR